MEMIEKLHLPILLGTKRQGRESEKVAHFLLKYINENFPEIVTELVDPRDFNFTLDQEGTALAEFNPKWQTMMQNAEGLIVVTPEYNFSFPGSLKIILDSLTKEYKHKALGIVGVSSGNFGGARAIESLVPVARKLGFYVNLLDLYFPNAQNAFSDDGEVLNKDVLERINKYINELIWLTKTLKLGREKYG